MTEWVALNTIFDGWNVHTHRDNATGSNARTIGAGEGGSDAVIMVMDMEFTIMRMIDSWIKDETFLWTVPSTQRVVVNSNT